MLCILRHTNCILGISNLVKRSTLRSFHFSASLEKLVKYKLSDIGEGIAEVQIKEWYIKVGDAVNEFDEICSVQSDKATVTITSRYEGLIKKLYYEVDDIAKVGNALIDIDVKDDKDAVKTESSDSPVSEHSIHAIKDVSENLSKKFLATPAVRRIIRQHNIDIGQVNGTGRDGRVLKEDALKHIQAEKQADSVEIFTAPSPQLLTTGKNKVVPIRGYTRTMIKSMTEALKIPHFGYYDEFVVDRLIESRNELNNFGKSHQKPKLSYMPLIIKATSLALKDFPILNSSIDNKMENMIYKSYHNISLAIDTPGGLAVPNIKNCDLKNIWEIANDLSRLVELGAKQKFSPNDLTDGTFSLSNIGAVGGGTYMKPIIFSPQVAIGAIGRIQKVARIHPHTGVFFEQSILNFSWAADHRVIDGATMARFSNRLKQFIENPTILVAELR